MAAAVAGMAVAAGKGPSLISGFESVVTSYPRFADHLDHLSGTTGARGRRGERTVTKVVAIDGPAGAGKSTLAQAVADHLGLERLDTGAMYRAVAWQALARGVDPDDADAVAELARRLTIEVGDRVTVDGRDVTGEIRTAAVDRAVSAVAANPEVRATLVARQRQWVAERGAGVVEGRDIGTVVLPRRRPEDLPDGPDGGAGPAAGRGT